MKASQAKTPRENNLPPREGEGIRLGIRDRSGVGGEEGEGSGGQEWKVAFFSGASYGVIFSDQEWGTRDEHSQHRLT